MNLPSQEQMCGYQKEVGLTVCSGRRGADYLYPMRS